MLWLLKSLSVIFLFLSLSAKGQSSGTVILPPSKPKESARPAPNPAHEKKKAILAVLQKQVEDWNHHSLEAFLLGYWKSDTLRMVSVRGVTYSWEKMAASIKKNFPDTASMGKLEYDVIHVELIGEVDALVTGKWLRKVDKKFKGGYFTFLFRKLKGKWVIVSDHTT